MTIQGTTNQRGYGWSHQQQRKQWAKAMVQQGGAPCARCGGWIYPDEPWHLDHDDVDRTMYLGPSHAYCNHSAGGLKARHPMVVRPRSREW